jgi:cardiolipin synthase A/B
MSSLEMKLISAAEYYDALLTSIPKAKRRIVIHAMTILWNTQTETIAAQLSSALERGVEVHIVGDIYSKFYANTPRLMRTMDNRKWAHTRAINIKLEAEGAHIKYVGRLGLNPYKGRTHSKVTIVDDTAYTFGGVNFTDGSFHNHDYMLRIKDRELCEELYQLVLAIGEAKQPLPDRVVPLSASATMLFDGGMPSSSAIYDKACEIVGKAKKVYYVSQMVPSGRLGKLVTSVENECYFNHPTQANTPSNLAILVDQTRYGIKNLYKGKTYIHAKFILCQYADGSKHLISGSNNFSWRGIVYGTREIAVHSTDTTLWDSFYEYMQREIVK